MVLTPNNPIAYSRSSFSFSARRSSISSCTMDFSPGLSLKTPQNAEMVFHIFALEILFRFVMPQVCAGNSSASIRVICG